MIWLIYLILIHLLAVPGAYMLLVGGLMLFLTSTTNVLTGETLPWARGMGWSVIGGIVAAAAVAAFWWYSNRIG